jgi:hypothetical protein
LSKPIDQILATAMVEAGRNDQNGNDQNKGLPYRVIVDRVIVLTDWLWGDLLIQPSRFCP